MRLFLVVVPGVLAFAATGVSAQPAPSEHAQHQAIGQHQATATDQKCCCEDMMRKMMSEMMQQHQGIGMPQAPKANSGQHPAGADQHPHD